MKYLSGIILLLLSTTAFSQSINVGFNSTHSGRNVTVQFEKQFKKHEFSIGLGYNINKYAHPDNQNYIYKKRFYASNAAEHLNLNLTYQRYVLPNLDCIKPFLFYDFQGRYGSTHNDLTGWVSSTGDGGRVYTEHMASFGPFAWLENNIGIGFTADITDRFYLKQKFGGGAMLIVGSDKQLPGDGVEWELSTLIHFSVGMRL